MRNAYVLTGWCRFVQRVCVGLLACMLAAPVYAIGGTVMITTWDGRDLLVASGYEEENISAAPSSGSFMNESSLDVYYYSESLKSLVYTHEAGQPTSSEEQDGWCTYVPASWDDPDAHYTYGVCLSLRAEADANRSYTMRFDVRRLGGAPVNVYVEIDFFDDSGNRTGLSARPYGAYCSSTIAAGVQVQQCSRQRMEALNQAFVPAEATTYCYRAYAEEFYAGQSPSIILTVQGQCRAI